VNNYPGLHMLLLDSWCSDTWFSTL